MIWRVAGLTGNRTWECQLKCRQTETLTEKMQDNVDMTAKFYVFQPKPEHQTISAKLSRTSTSILSQNVYTGEGQANCLQASEMRLCQHGFPGPNLANYLEEMKFSMFKMC